MSICLRPDAIVRCLVCDHSDPQGVAAIGADERFCCRQCGVVNDVGNGRAPALGTTAPKSLPRIEAPRAHVQASWLDDPASGDPYRRALSRRVVVTWRGSVLLGAVMSLLLLALGVMSGVVAVVSAQHGFTLVAVALGSIMPVLLYVLAATALNRATLVVSDDGLVVKTGPIPVWRRWTLPKLQGSPQSGSTGSLQWPPSMPTRVFPRPMASASFRDPAIVYRESFAGAESTSYWYSVVFVDANDDPHEITIGDLQTARLVYAALAGLDMALPVGTGT